MSEVEDPETLERAEHLLRREAENRKALYYEPENDGVSGAVCAGGRAAHPCAHGAGASAMSYEERLELPGVTFGHDSIDGAFVEVDDSTLGVGLTRQDVLKVIAFLQRNLQPDEDHARSHLRPFIDKLNER